MNGIPEATRIVLSAEERTELEGLVRSTKTEYRLRQRARIVLLAAGGMASRAIGRTVGCTTGTTSKWRVRYADRRLAGLDETGERGAEPKYTAETGKRILALLDQPPPKGCPLDGPLLAAALGDLDVQYVWRFLRAQKIDLAGRKSWCERNDPEFVAKAADVVGLYMAPPENAIVICVDEKIWLPSRRQKSAQPQASLVACGSIPPRSLPPPVACAPGKPWMRWSPTPLGRHQVVRIVRGQKLGVRVVVILLVQRGADALRGASAHMACERHRVHERAAVMHRNVIEEALSDLSCVSVSLLGDIVGISFGSDGVSRRP